jgi:polar amino acid transport system substrate-binding protein
MSGVSRKLVVSIVSVLVVAAALIWLLFRTFSGGYIPGTPTYYIGRDETWYPLDLRGKEKNMVGFANDLLREIADLEGFRAQVFEVGRNALFDGLNTDSYDAVLSSLDPNVSNRRRYEFSDLFYSLGPVIVVREGSTASSFQDLEGKILGIEGGALQNYNLPEPPDIVIIPYDTAATALEKLDGNLLDAVVMDALRAHVYTDGFYKGRLKVATSPLTDRGLRLVTKKNPDNVLFVSQFNDGLRKVKENGTYATLMEKWGLIQTELKESSER